MIKIAVFGHSADSFASSQSIAHNIDDAIAVIKRQHPEKDVCFILNCEPGIGQWFCDALLEHQIPYEVYLPGLPQETACSWLEEQQILFMQQLNKSKAVRFFGEGNAVEFRIKRDRKAVDDSQWILVFWNGKHQGFTYQAMQYAIQNNKIVFNGINGLKLIDGEVLKIQ